MDMLLSLPIASYFFSSSLTSWSTSLNLLFFYMTWSTLVLSHSPLKIELVGVAALRSVLWLAPSLVFLALDTLVPSVTASIKQGGASALPPRDVRALARLVALALFNLALGTATEGAVSFAAATALGTPVFRTSTTLPLPWQMAKHVALLLAARETLTYYIHRYVLHASAKTRRCGGVAARHHARNAAHTHAAAPFSLLLMADHPLPFLLHRFVPLYLPALALALANRGHSLHLLTYFLFVGLSTLEETLVLSGYSVVPGILVGGIARRTALHYTRPSSSSATGNFGAWGVLDWAHGTNLGGRDVVRDVRDEAGKHGAGDMVRDGVKGLRRSARSRGHKSRSTARGDSDSD